MQPVLTMLLARVNANMPALHKYTKKPFMGTSSSYAQAALSALWRRPPQLGRGGGLPA
jgi:hypothetical protein